MDRYFGCSFFTTFFLREKESGGKKSAHKGDCAAIRCAPIRRSLPLIYPPDDCSADSDSIGLYPKRSASVKPPVSKKEYNVLNFSFSHLQSVYTRSWEKYITALIFCCDSLYIRNRSWVNKRSVFYEIKRTTYNQEVVTDKECKNKECTNYVFWYYCKRAMCELSKQKN